MFNVNLVQMPGLTKVVTVTTGTTIEQACRDGFSGIKVEQWSPRLPSGESVDMSHPLRPSNDQILLVKKKTKGNFLTELWRKLFS